MKGYYTMEWGYAQSVRKSLSLVSMTICFHQWTVSDSCVVGSQRVSFDPRPPPRVFKGLHGSNVKAIIKP